MNNSQDNLDTTQAKDSQPASKFKSKSELKSLSKLAVPIFISQMAQMGMGTVDAVMSGNVSTEDLAAIAIGTSLWTPLWLFIAGILLVLSPKFAQLLSSQQQNRIIPLLGHGNGLALLIGIIASILLITISPQLEFLLPSTGTAQKMQDYVFAVALGLPAASMFISFRFHAEALGNASSVTAIMITGLILNIPINAIFVYGLFGMPELGGVGCGWGTFIVFHLMLLAIFIDCWLKRTSKDERQISNFIKFNFEESKDLLKTGLPIGTSIFFEVSFFSVIALLLSPLGDAVVAGHQVALNIASLTFMVPLSISMAITVRVGHHIGLNSYRNAFKTGWLGVKTNVVFSLLNASIIVLFSRAIAGVYTPDIQVIDLAVQLLVLAALFQISDAIQIGAAGALRAFQDTVIVMIISFLAYWVMGIGLGYYLAFSENHNMGAHGFWWGLITGLTLAAVLLALRMRQLNKKLLGSGKVA